MATTVLAIDPGASGGIAFKSITGGCGVTSMPSTEGEIIGVLRGFSIGTAYLEQLVKHMGAGIPASTMAVYASNWGFIKGALQMAGWRIILVRPQDWQKALGLGITGRQKADVKGLSIAAANLEKKRIKTLNNQLKRDWKNKLLAEAQRRFPDLKVTLKTADALLILEYAKIQEGRTQ